MPKLHSQETLKEDFERIYRENVWGGDNGVGTGSTYSIMKPYVDNLQFFLKFNKIESVVDLGCSFWNMHQKIDWTGINYIGYDVIQDAIDFNTKCFAKENIIFLCANALEVDLPQSDLLIIKDVMQHWYTEEILSFIPKLSFFKYCLITNDEKEDSINPDYRELSIDNYPGRYGKLKITDEPFNIKAVAIWRHLSKVTRLLVN